MPAGPAMGQDGAPPNGIGSKKGATRDVAACAYCVAGIYLFFILFGIAQERINTREYGASKERMTHTLALIFAQCSTNVALAALALRLSPAAAKRRYINPLAVGKLGASYVCAMFCSNLALQYIDYPTQVLIKSCKMVPVMAASVLMGVQRYTLAAKLRVLLLTAGICAFLLAKPAAHGRAHGGAGEPDRLKLIGLALALGSLACDGYTGGAQDRLVREVRPSSHQLMLWTNLWAMGLLAAALVLSGQGAQAVGFALRHPEMLADLALFCGASALGQNFIYFSIARFGALPTAVITTTRKFFTILASVLWFGHPLGAAQWLAVLLVFSALSSELHHKLKAGLGGGAAARHGARERRGRRGSGEQLAQPAAGGGDDATGGLLAAPPSDTEDGEAAVGADAAALEAGRSPRELERAVSGLAKQRSSPRPATAPRAGPGGAGAG